MTWLPPPARAAAAQSLEPWRPKPVAKALGPGVDWDSLGYIVVDEVQEDVCGLVLSRWPKVDERGRLHFGEESDSSRIPMMLPELLALLRDERKPIVPIDLDEEQERAVADREIQIGDVFAAKLRQDPRDGRGQPREPVGDWGGPVDAPESPDAWLAPPILDITAEAVEVAKAQASAALSGVVDQSYLELVAAELTEDEEGPSDTTPTPTVPTPLGPSPDVAAPAAAATDETETTRASAPERPAGAARGAANRVAGAIERLRERLRSRRRREVAQGEEAAPAQAEAAQGKGEVASA